MDKWEKEMTNKEWRTKELGKPFIGEMEMKCSYDPSFDKTLDEINKTRPFLITIYDDPDIWVGLGDHYLSKFEPLGIEKDEKPKMELSMELTDHKETNLEIVPLEPDTINYIAEYELIWHQGPYLLCFAYGDGIEYDRHDWSKDDEKINGFIPL